MAVDVGETAVDAVVAPRQLRVVDAEEFRHRGMHVVHRGRMVAIERLMIGSNWPVSDRDALFADTVANTKPFVKAR